MKEEPKTKKQLIKELEKLQQQIISLKKTKTKGDLKKDLFQLAQLALNNSTDAISWIKKDGHILYVNDTGCKLLGYSREEMLTKTVHDIDPGYTPEVWKNYWKELKRNGSLAFETVAQKKDGTIIPVEVTANYIKHGNDEYNFAFSKDITQRKEAERELKKYRDNLEDLVKNRTLELSIANQKLNKEISERRKSEEEIQKTKEYLENIFMTSVDGLIITDSNGRITAVNKATEKIFDCSPEQLVGKHNSEMEFDEKQAKISRKEIRDKLWSEGTISGVERTLKKPDGSFIIVEMNIAVLKDDEGNMRGSVASIRDTTDRKQAEEKLAETRDYLENIIESSLDGIVVSDNMGYITRANKTFLKMLGYREEEIIGKHLIECAPLEEGNYESTIGELIEINDNFFKSMKTAMASFLHDGKVTNRRTFYLTKDKKLLPAEDNLVFLFNNKGNRIGAVGVIRDISGRNRMEKELNDSKEFLEDIFKHSADGIMVTDPKGLITLTNEALEKLLGYSKEELLGKQTIELVPQGENYIKQGNEFLTKLFEEGIVTGFQYNWLRKDKSIIDVEANSALLTDNEGNITGVVAVIRDITQRKLSEQKLIDYQKRLKGLTTELISSEQKERQKFADFLHDEIGQQLFATRLHLEDLRNSSSSVENTKTLGTALDNLYRVINQTRSLTTELSSPILNQLGLEKALEWLAEQTHKKYDIMVTFEDDNQEKSLDENVKIFLYQAVTELLINVAKHAQTKNASISIKKENSKIRISVEDEGVGFNPSKEHLYDVKNEGFGLFRIKERLEQLGGQIEIESQPNRGTQVILTAPCRNVV